MLLSGCPERLTCHVVQILRLLLAPSLDGSLCKPVHKAYPVATGQADLTFKRPPHPSSDLCVKITEPEGCIMGGGQQCHETTTIIGHASQ